MNGGVWMEVAWSIHERTCRPWVVPRIRGVAYPFGTPAGMPPHLWRVSWDVMQALTEAAPPPIGDNPKTSEGVTKLLFGWPIDVDRDASPGTLALEPLPPGVPTLAHKAPVLSTKPPPTVTTDIVSAAAPSQGCRARS